MPQLRGLKEFSFTCGAGESRTLPIGGDWCQVHECDASGALIAFDEVPSGRWYEGQGRRVYYDKVRVTSDTAQTVKLLLGFGHATDARAVVNANVDTTIEPGNTIDDGGDVVCGAGARTLLLAADPGVRRYAILKNVSSNSITVRIGTVAVGAANGVPLEPGETLPYGTDAAVYAWNPGAVDVTINAAAIAQV